MSFDHSKLTSKHFLNLLGYCVCEHCRKLPELAPRTHGNEAAGAGDLGQIDDSSGDDIGPCPSCGATVRVTMLDDPRSGRQRRAILHPMPFCSYYGETAPDVMEEEIYRRRGLIP